MDNSEPSPFFAVRKTEPPSDSEKKSNYYSKTIYFEK